MYVAQRESITIIMAINIYNQILNKSTSLLHLTLKIFMTNTKHKSILQCKQYLSVF